MPSRANTGILAKTDLKAKIAKPSLYVVIILNDDYTPMEFVIHVLQALFGKPREEAVSITMAIHTKGVGRAGVFTLDVAETKVFHTLNLASRNQHPLQCAIEPA